MNFWFLCYQPNFISSDLPNAINYFRFIIQSDNDLFLRRIGPPTTPVTVTCDDVKYQTTTRFLFISLCHYSLCR